MSQTVPEEIGMDPAPIPAGEGVVQLVELLQALRQIAHFAGSVLKDSKVGVEDLQYLLALAPKLELISNGFKGLDLVKKELSNLDQAEVVRLVPEFYGVVEAFVKAKKA